MKKITKLILIGLCIIFCLGTLTACGGDEAPEIPESRIMEDLQTKLKDGGKSFDTIEDFKYELVDVTEDDLNRLKEFFDNRVTYQKIDCSFSLKSLKVDCTGEWSMIYAYFNGEWQVMFDYAKDPESWEYKAKDTVSASRILSDLKSVEFEGFQKGYVGNETKSSIKVLNRDTKLNINRDDIYVEITVKTDYASYTIEAELVYVFNNGEWRLDESDVQETQYWKVKYASDRIPETPDETYVLEQLTKPNYFLTYVANLEYADSYTLTATKQLAGVTNITYQYEFVTFYDNIGEITYLVEIPYEWMDGEWSIGEVSRDVYNIKVGEMLGTWTADNGDTIEFKTTEKPLGSAYESPNVVVGTYHKNNNGTNADYSIKMALEIPLRDNNWTGKINLWEAASTTSIEYSVSDFSIDTENNTITTNGITFTKTADLPDIDIEGNPITTETSETPATSETSETPSTEEPSSETSETSESSESIESSDATSEETPSTEETSEKTGIDG